MVDIVIPWRGGCLYRERAYGWVKVKLIAAGWEITEAPLPEHSPWIKAKAIMPAIEYSKAQIIVIHDADVWCEGLPAAIDAVIMDGAKWAIPHGDVLRLNETATKVYMNTGIIEEREYDRPPYRGMPGGGIVVAPRDTLLDIPMDPRFEGWGQEDSALGAAMTTMLGKPWRGSERLLHLFHPPQQRVTRKWGSEFNRLLYMEYHAALGKRGTMRAILDQAHDALRSAH